jgi:DNA-binding winged helix-turn-helix (wHTH) protein
MPDRNEETPLLVGHEGPLNGQRWIINADLILGRAKKCDIYLPNRQVSRQHARIKLTKDGVLLEDMGSRNGTHRNGNPVTEPVRLADGDIIQIAFAQKFVYLSSDATLPLEIDEFIDEVAPIGRLRLDKKSRRVWINGEEITPPLSVSQFRLLEILYQYRGRVVSREDLISGVWGEENAAGVTEQALDALVRRLRDRLASIDASHDYVITVRGHGLRLDNPLP